MARPLLRDGDCDRNAGISSVEEIISVANIVYINVVGLVPVLAPVFRHRVKATEPIAAVLEAGISANRLEREAIDVESVAPTIVATEIRCRNAVAVIAAALIPSAVVGLPVACPMPLPSGTLHLLLLWRDPLLPGLPLPDRLLPWLPVLGVLLLGLSLLGSWGLPGLLLMLGMLLLGLSTLLLLGLSTLLLLGLSTLLLLGLSLLASWSLPGLLLVLGTLLFGLTLLGGWGLLVLLLLMLCARRNCDPKN
jgi:hypothetical protein